MQRAKELNDAVEMLRGKLVTRNEKIKYLGVWIDDVLNWSDHIQAVCRKCSTALAQLRRLRDTLPYVTKRNIFNDLILPQIWGRGAKYKN